MKKEGITSKRSQALGGKPYSPAIKIGDFIFTAGQIADDPGADIRTQTEQVLEKIKGLLETAGASMDNVVKCTVFLSNLDDYTGMNKVYEKYFRDNPPARSAVEVSRLVKGAKLEIEAIAVIP